MKKNLLAFLFLIPTFCMAQLAVPELWVTRIHDDANTLSPSFASQLNAELQAYEDSTSNQIAIMIVPSLEGEILEEYTLRVAESLKAGQKDKDNGVLIFVAVNDRKARIEVGEGLEGVLTDATCNQIIRNEMAPYFRQ